MIKLTKLLKNFLNHFFIGIKLGWKNQGKVVRPRKGSNFIFDFFFFLHYKRYEINLNCEGSYIDFADWIKVS